MALEAEEAADGLIRQVQKVLGKASPAAAFASLLYGRKGLDGLEQLPADRLAGNAREALAFIADQAEGPAQGPRPPHGRRRQRRAAGRRADRDRQRRHAVPRRLGAGRAAGPRHRRAPAAAPDLQDPARQGRPPADDRARRRRQVERRPPGKLHRRPPRGPAGAGGARSRRHALGHPRGGARRRRRLEADARAPRGGGAGAGDGAGQRAARPAGRVDGLSANGSERTTSHSWASREFELSGRRGSRRPRAPSRAAGSACCATPACRCCAAAPSWWP